MISLHNFFTHIMNTEPQLYEFPHIEDISFDENNISVNMEDTPDKSMSQQTNTWYENPIAFADVQANIILQQAEQKADNLMRQAEESIRLELEKLRQQAEQEGYQAGYSKGIEVAIRDTHEQTSKQIEKLEREVKLFLEEATAQIERELDESKEDMQNLALTVAEKVVQMNLKSSGEAILSMICNATEKMKRKEWIHIYVAGSDIKEIAEIRPSLTTALASLSSNIKIVPMSESKSGTCIIEMPDEIVDASVSTQLDNIRNLCSEFQ